MLGASVGIKCLIIDVFCGFNLSNELQIYHDCPSDKYPGRSLGKVAADSDFRSIEVVTLLPKFERVVARPYHS